MQACKYLFNNKDRLRDWHPRVARKLVNLACLTIGGLDIDAIRVDKATQSTANFATDVLAPGLRDCAKLYGKENFFIPAEITSGVDFGTRYVGKGRQLSNLLPDMYASVQKILQLSMPIELRPVLIQRLFTTQPTGHFL